MNILQKIKSPTKKLTILFITFLMCFLVIRWNIAYSAHKPYIPSQDIPSQIHTNNPKPQAIVMIVIGVLVLVTGAAAIYTIIKAADRIPKPKTNAVPDELNISLNNEALITELRSTFQNGIERDVSVQKSYDNGRTWNTFTNIYSDPYEWEVRDYNITNGIIPIYRAFIVK